ncbi:alpha/beta hydrolase [Corynebacterium anserum]|uniref:Esterase family protein n=1 Tax=Corynebacterium anserum TaxID=2684406 RepID=A0A7G7YLM6_9CORY|nr:alpha/beta hydrolase family protein [Corynebacterium anserum]MBC2681446.1 esterase family protein [Corynebacterium anserum]QNH95396.1 esterase family protein [Corynebacterium anserum]
MTSTHTSQPLVKRLVSLLVAVATALGLAVAAAPAASANRDQLRKGCTWGPENWWVQNCWLYSQSMGQMIQVQIRAAKNGGNAGLYLLDGMRASSVYNEWSRAGRAPQTFVDDNVTLVMPVGGMAQFYTDWNGSFVGPDTHPKNPKWETFLTRELPAYLQSNFGVSPTNNAIAGLSMGGTAALNLAANHRDQFKQVTSLSGYTSTADPAMYAALQVAMLDVAGPGAQIWNMWGVPGSEQLTRNDPTTSAVIGKYKGINMFLSAATGVTTPEELGLWVQDPGGVLAGMGLEFLARATTSAFEASARAGGANIATSYPAMGIHNWGLWSNELGAARGQIKSSVGA